MPKNLRGGKGHKKGKNNNPSSEQPARVQFAEEDQVYALVKNKLGGNKLAVECSDGKNRIAIIPGRFRRKLFINPNDVVLCDLESVGDDKNCYIDHKFKNNEISVLKNKKLLGFDVKEDPSEKREDGFMFKDKKKENEKAGYDILYPESNSDEEESYFNPNIGLIPSKRDEDKYDKYNDEKDEVDDDDIDAGKYDKYNYEKDEVDYNDIDEIDDDDIDAL